MIFRLVSEETDIPRNKRVGKKVRKGNLCFMLRKVLLETFDQDEGKYIHRLFDDKCKNQFGAAIMGFSDPFKVPTMISGCTVRLSRHGAVLQYLTTDPQVLYEGKYGRGQDGHPFAKRGFGKYLIYVCQVLSLKIESTSTIFCSLLVQGFCGTAYTAH